MPMNWWFLHQFDSILSAQTVLKITQIRSSKLGIFLKLEEALLLCLFHMFSNGSGSYDNVISIHSLFEAYFTPLTNL